MADDRKVFTIDEARAAFFKGQYDGIAMLKEKIEPDPLKAARCRVPGCEGTRGWYGVQERRDEHGRQTLQLLICCGRFARTGYNLVAEQLEIMAKSLVGLEQGAQYDTAMQHALLEFMQDMTRRIEVIEARLAKPLISTLFTKQERPDERHETPPVQGADVLNADQARGERREQEDDAGQRREGDGEQPVSPSVREEAGDRGRESNQGGTNR